MRVDELRAGIYALEAFSGMEYHKFKETHARHVPFETYLQYKDKLPLPWAKRCEHWYTEFQRAEQGAEAWRVGDIDTFGKLSFDSGWSSIHNWESGAPEQIRLYEIMREIDGIYGGRPAFEESIVQHVSERYLKDYPHLKEKYSVHICESADGAKL